MPRTKPVFAAAAAMLIAPSGCAADKPSGGCSPQFTETTIEGATQLERTQQAIADSMITVEQARANYKSLDANGDGVICYTLPGVEVANNPVGQYLYRFQDNSASAPK